MQPIYPICVRTVIATGLVLLISSGCVRRRLTVRTNPPGALVSVDNQVIGTTPVASSFTFYAARDIRVEKEGYQTQTIRHRIDPPWYQIPPLDFITETLIPKEIRDERVVDITLAPEIPEANSVVLSRADELRLQSRQGVIPATGNTTLTPVNVSPNPATLQVSPVPLGLPEGGVPFRPLPTN